MTEFHVLLPAEYCNSIMRCKARSGGFDVALARHDSLMVVTGWEYHSSAHGDVRTRGGARLHDDHFVPATAEGNGFWYLVEPEFQMAWLLAAERRGCLPVRELRGAVTGWREPGGGTTQTPILTLARGSGSDEVSAVAWMIRGGDLVPLWCDVIDVGVDRLAALEGHWPLPDLVGQKIVVLGAGSVGAPACQALATYGARRLTLIDPDHLEFRNFARHPARRSDVGRLKVRAVAADLASHDDAVHVDALPIDVIHDADLVRGELATADAALVCVDGVEPRRVANHLAVRARVPAIFACVLDNGRVGEVLRVLPQRHECLLCHRRRLADIGAFDLEEALDRGYGTGTRKLPMTAVGGDLALVGRLAAKVTIATVLERAGHRDQRLRGEHACIGLRPSPELPEPFAAGLGEVTWSRGHPPASDCPTCRWT